MQEFPLHEADPGAVPYDIAESKRAEQRLSSIIASVIEPILAIDERHQITLVNPAVEKMFGYSEAQLLGKPISMLIPERYREAHDAHIRNFARTKVSNRGMGGFGQIVGRRADGREFLIGASIAQMEWAGERQFTVVLRDVTQRIEAEQALRKNNELLDRIFATTHLCIVYLDRDFNFVRVNQAYADACGYPSEFFVGKNHFDLYPGERVEAIFRNVVATREPFTIYANPFEFPNHPEWGVTYWDWTLHALKTEDGHVEGLLFALLDVTQRKRAEEELHVNERSLRVALKSVDMALFHQDLDLRYTWMYSPQLWYRPEDVIGKMDSELLPPEDAPPIIELKRRVLETGVSARAEVSVTKLNQKYYFDLVVEPLVDATGKCVGVTGASTDITERKRTEEELKRKTALAQLLESLARAANEAATPEEAMKICLSRLCDFGNWTLGRVATTDQLGSDPGIPGDSVWQAADLPRHREFIRASQNVRSLAARGQFIYLVLRDKKPVWLPDITEAYGFVRRDAALADGLRAAFAFPMVVQGEVVAFLEFYADTPRPIEPDLVAASEMIAAQIARLIERSRAMRRQTQLAVIVENSNDAIISCGLDRTIQTWNAAAERLFGYAAAEIIGRDAHTLVPDDQQAEVNLRFARFKAGVSVPAYETVHLGKDGRRVAVSGTLSPIMDLSKNLKGISFIFRDISEHKRAEREHAQLAAIVESSNDAILMRGLDRTILSWNAAAERLFGWSAQEAVGQRIELIVPPERTGAVSRFIEGAARGEWLTPVETIHLSKDGARIPTQVTFSPVRDQQGNVIAHSYTVRDMTDLKRKEEALRGYASRLSNLSRRLREVEESERRAISRELHDRIGQDLSTLGLVLGSLGAKLSQESRRPVEKQLDDMQGLLKSMVANVRDVMAELRPPVLDDYGLLAALRQLVTEFAKRTGIAAELSGVDLQPRPPSVVETVMYRISQEALNNIAKHAQAKNVEISLHAALDRVVLEIADDGIGFDANETPPDKQHWGMTTMRERAEAVGVVFRLESAPGTGTRIVLEAERAAI